MTSALRIFLVIFSIIIAIESVTANAALNKITLINKDGKENPANKFIVYYGGWEGDTYKLENLPKTVTAVNLSFANITNNYQIDTSISGYLTKIPAEGSQMWPSYINWTQFKYNRPEAKVLLSVGGATFSTIWTHLLTAETADTIAKNLASTINQPYPVYKAQFATTSDLLGYVTIDGIDLDIEADSRLSPQVASNIVLLIQDLKKYLLPEKMITLATYSVGADSLQQCTVPGSDHCGEDIPVLQQAGSLINWVNVMAYDAGQEYAVSGYKTALANYAVYVGKNKVLLGLDVQNQWPGFQETAAQLAIKAAWQQQNGYGGIMFWGVGIVGNPLIEQAYLDNLDKAFNTFLRRFN